MNVKHKYTQLIKTEAERLDFLSCGVSKAEFLEKEAPRLEKWLNKNKHDKMRYMENHLYIFIPQTYKNVSQSYQNYKTEVNNYSN